MDKADEKIAEFDEELCEKLFKVWRDYGDALLMMRGHYGSRNDIPTEELKLISGLMTSFTKSVVDAMKKLGYGKPPEKYIKNPIRQRIIKWLVEYDTPFENGTLPSVSETVNQIISLVIPEGKPPIEGRITETNHIIHELREGQYWKSYIPSYIIEHFGIKPNDWVGLTITKLDDPSSSHSPMG